jgi:S1-C subfamily serine protease
MGGMSRRLLALVAVLGGALLAGLLVTSCASSNAERASPAPVGEQPTPMVMASPAPSPAAEPPQPPTPEPAACTAFVKPGVLKRSAVVRVVEAGIGRWLAGGAEVERKIAKSRFQGWEIRRLYSGDPCYATVDLRPHDVVIRVNGKPIEKPEQAFDVLSSLRTAPELVVDFLRDGQPQKLTLQIADE